LKLCGDTAGKEVGAVALLASDFGGGLSVIAVGKNK
jgi:hypothetical protein